MTGSEHHPPRRNKGKYNDFFEPQHRTSIAPWIAVANDGMRGIKRGARDAPPPSRKARQECG